MSATEKLAEAELEAARQTFARDGYFILRGVVPADYLATFHEALAAEFDKQSASGELFSGGGLVSGHLNCFPGERARFVYETLQQRGVIDLIKSINAGVVRLPNVGCNFNLPGSHTQHWHLDRPYNREFMIANVTVVDTTEENGATDVIPGSDKKFYKYSQFVLQGLARSSKRVLSKRGDVVVRSSNVWHRGMTNHSASPRPMLAFTWEDGGSNEADPFSANGGKIRFLPNWFKLTPLGRLREQIFVKVPAAYSTLRFARSLVDSEY